MRVRKEKRLVKVTGFIGTQEEFVNLVALLAEMFPDCEIDAERELIEGPEAKITIQESGTGRYIDQVFWTC